MPSYTPNPAVQSHLENQVGFMTELSRKSYDSARKLSELNMQFAQHVLEDSISATRQMLSASNVFQWSAMLANQIGPVTQRLQSYQQQLFGLLSGAQVDFTRATESYMPEASRSATAIADEMARRAEEARQAFTGHPGNGAAYTRAATNGSGQTHS